MLVESFWIESIYFFKSLSSSSMRSDSEISYLASFSLPSPTSSISLYFSSSWSASTVLPSTLVLTLSRIVSIPSWSLLIYSEVSLRIAHSFWCCCLRSLKILVPSTSSLTVRRKLFWWLSGITFSICVTLATHQPNAASCSSFFVLLPFSFKVSRAIFPILLTYFCRRRRSVFVSNLPRLPFFLPSILRSLGGENLIDVSAIVVCVAFDDWHLYASFGFSNYWCYTCCLIEFSSSGLSEVVLLLEYFPRDSSRKQIGAYLVD